MFDIEFRNKLKAFYSFSLEHRRTGRTTILAEALLKVAVESGKEIRYDVDHHLQPGRKQTTDEVLFKMEEIAYDYRQRTGDNLVIDADRRRGNFKAYFMGSYHRENDTRGYNVGSPITRFLNSYINANPVNQDSSPFDKKKIKERIEFLNEELLLLL